MKRSTDGGPPPPRGLIRAMTEPTNAIRDASYRRDGRPLGQPMGLGSGLGWHMRWTMGGGGPPGVQGEAGWCGASFES